MDRPTLPEAPDIPDSETSHGSVLVWQGFDYDWERTPHRLSRLASILEHGTVFSGGEIPNLPGPLGSLLENRPSLPVGAVSGLYISRFSVGDFKSLFELTGTAGVGGPVTNVGIDVGEGLGANVSAFPEVGHGRTRFSRVSGTGARGSAFAIVDGYSSVLVSGPVGAEQTRSGPRVFVARPPAIGGGPLEATAILRGFDISCVSSDSGVHTRGFGFQIRDLDVGNDGLSFTPEVFIHPDNSPDPLHKSDDYAYLLTLYYTAILARRGQLRFTTDTPEAPTASTSYRGKGDEEPRRYPADVQGEGGGAFNQGVIGVRGFEWRLAEFKKTKRDGRYLRRILCSVTESPEQPLYDPQTGEANFQANFVFSNKGIIPTGFEAQHKLFATLIQFNSSGQAPTRELHNVMKATDTDEAVDPFVV